MAVELWSIHALDFGDAGLVVPSMLDPCAVFEHIDTFGKVIDEEMTGCITSGFLVAHAKVLPRAKPQRRQNFLRAALASVEVVGISISGGPPNYGACLRES